MKGFRLSRNPLRVIVNQKSSAAIRKHALMSLWQLIRLVDEDDDGLLSGSAYATAGVVDRLARTARPWSATLVRLGLTALARSRNGDGSWGNPHARDEYRVVPTLAVVCALRGLDAAVPAHHEWVGAAIRRGSRFLFADPEVFAPTRLPGLDAVEYTIPSLLDRLHDLTGTIADGFGPALQRARMLQQANAGRCADLRSRALAGDRAAWREFPLELLTAPPRGWAGLPVRNGAVSSSPVLTATVISAPGSEIPGAERYLRREALRHRGLWPVLAPTAELERATAAALFARIGLPLPPGLTASLCASLRLALDADPPVGVARPPGTDRTALADTDRAALAVFALNCWNDAADRRSPPDLPSTASTLATAHILEALTTVARSREIDRRRADFAVRALVETQEPDGHWADRRVASPYPPTAAATMALARAIESEFCAEALLAVSRSIAWLLAVQRPDGSWGIWHPTTEETACVVHALCTCVNPRAERVVAAALRRAHHFLAGSYDASETDAVRTPLWHYEDLGSPLRLERLATLTALLLSGAPVP
ncbi:hypothetical protein [Nocardia tengchongensis]|uniref:hypothetical protein n=1 Tax=Nocardia tengchongensis TaxID=2055889 RepID=UPI0036460529